MRAIEPIKITLIDGKEREFLLSYGGLRRLKSKFSAKSIQELMAKDSEEAVLSILWEALLDKSGIENEDAFADMLSANIPELAKSVTALLGVSLPQRTDSDPQIPTPTSALQ